MSFLISALAIILVFGIVIFVHEFGHFIVAKKSGVKVERFSFGLGPEAVGFQWGETRYCLAWIPLGGEVRMAGEAEFEEGESDTPKPRDPRDFFAQPWYKRVPIVLAGPAMNYVLAVVVFALGAMIWGNPQPTQEAVIGDMIEGYPAHAAGLKPGDRVLSLNGESVQSWQELAQKIHALPEKQAVILVQRGVETPSITVVPRWDDSHKVGLIGISPAMVHVPVGFWASWKQGVQQSIGLSVFTLRYLGEKIWKREKPDLSGPIGIATVIAKATREGMPYLLFLIGLISVGIGLFNLFPIPLLDGGHLMFYLWEGVTRKPVSKRVMARANAVGLSLLLFVLVFATYSDIQRLRGPKNPPTASSEAQP